MFSNMNEKYINSRLKMSLVNQLNQLVDSKNRKRSLLVEININI
jgi:hypothetical protein